MLCECYKLADNAECDQSYILGQTLRIAVVIGAPHPRIASVSIVDTTTKLVIGAPMISWEIMRPLPRLSLPIQRTSTVLDDLGARCTEAGGIVILWVSDAWSIDQTYKARVKFTVGGE